MNPNHEVSFEQLSQQLSESLRGYLKRMIGNEAEVDDVFQQALIRIAQHLPLLENHKAVTPWAFRIATNAAIDHLRQSKRFDFVEFTETDAPTNEDEEDRLLLDEMNGCVREVIDTLPPDHKAAIVLFNLEGKSIAETARILNISKSATKVRIHRAKKRLREALHNECSYYTTREGTLRCTRKNNP